MMLPSGLLESDRVGRGTRSVGAGEERSAGQNLGARMRAHGATRVGSIVHPGRGFGVSNSRFGVRGPHPCDEIAWTGHPALLWRFSCGLGVVWERFASQMLTHAVRLYEQIPGMVDPMAFS